ncbi:MAG TPA: helix-turn-helix transcriptional regulator [Actinophytocola sp.]|jgi:ferric-dicitrate binding protein FerR (iron transport regulator)|uniref:helix-turn-helix domain-containing protein n=1 Tax=Actinophytocola sp. TaxID=1872138 RepID=UPI002DF91012|nr:helix-turn-helix transcriptional regulator [Actinophytocola sp.]
MPQSVEAQQFAACMQMFKNRVDRSYDALARRTGISSSSLHRYCTGTKIPADHGAAQRFAKECGATPPELRELHRLWALADARRKAPLEPAVELAPAKDSVARPRLALVGVAALGLLAGGAVWWVVSARTVTAPPLR